MQDRLEFLKTTVTAGALVAAGTVALSGCARPAQSPVLLAPNDTTAIVSGEPWRDSNRDVIEAHGGGMLVVGKTFYWYGENHALGGGNKTGISAYSSTDLLHWKNEGVVMPKDSLPMKFRDSGVAERPKVIYNRQTKQYVMWMHLDANRYAEASAGVAVSASPSGPFRLVRIFRPIIYDYGYGRTARSCTSETWGTHIATWRCFSTTTSVRTRSMRRRATRRCTPCSSATTTPTLLDRPSRERLGRGFFRARGARRQRRSRLGPSIT